jgi:Zn-finger protein
MVTRNSSKFFNNKECEYYPCHNMKDESINCLFCYCPLYYLESCQGHYVIKEGIKDCSNCTIPHQVGTYPQLIEKLQLRYDSKIISLLKRYRD